MIKINVLKRDIQRGVVGECGQCPIALAIKRATHRRTMVYDMEVETFRADSYRPTTYPLPAEAKKFIARFDDKKLVKPFSFRIHAS